MSGESAPQLPAQMLEAIYRHARAEFPNECCGYVLGSGDQAELVVCDNQQDRYHAVDPESYPRTAATAYTFGFKDLRRFNDSFESGPRATIIYHSHPRVGAYFSAEDTRAALSAGWPVDYLVVDCQDDEIREALLFRKHPTEPSFVEIARFEGAKI
ncbi:hypothetical protein ENSA5_69780 [Enhygromyxa salina]|uniref:JAB domain-containing protein n=1 Tax=Enhygromyxa salina TaxID=215803 RepID=A0A2S9XB62_9BACT|nr:Mov34/MPN/PAD-1 family protein [Enhygromyxa salina]PRP89941.1 hypothetical protein ENSA5_69780 [Enhygromyxa salina]